MRTPRSMACTWAVVAASILTIGCEPEDPQQGEDPPAPSGPWSVALEVDASAGALLSVWGEAPDDAWAVGGQVPSIGDDGVGAIFHRSASGWVQESVPEGTPLLNWVHGHDDAIWAVGNGGVALRYDGSAWNLEDTGAGVPLWGAYVFAADDVWAVGGDAFDRETPGIVVHYDGSSWTQQTLPELDRDSASMFKIFGITPDDLHVVGASGVILHYDGSSWKQVPSGTASDLISLWGPSADDIVAVGGRAVGTVSRYDGSSWNTMEIGQLAGLNGVWLDALGRASVVGNMGSASVILSDFAFEPEESMVGFEVLHAVYGFDDGTRYAVGGTLNSSPPYTGLIIENAP